MCEFCEKFDFSTAKAEIERLEDEADKIAEDYSNLIIEKDELFDGAEKLIKTAKLEAIKEFVERLKEKAVDVGICDAQGNGYGGATVILIGDIDNLAKEMEKKYNDNRSDN